MPGTSQAHPEGGSPRPDDFRRRAEKAAKRLIEKCGVAGYGDKVDRAKLVRDKSPEMKSALGIPPA
jgi:hypothetical protein